MPTEPYFNVTSTAANLVTGLTAGVMYIAQNVGEQEVSYCNYATDPTGENVGWLIVGPNEFFTFTVNTSDPVWVRTQSRHGSTLAVTANA